MFGLTEIQLMNSAAHRLARRRLPERSAITPTEIRKEESMAIALAEDDGRSPIEILDEHAKWRK